MIRNSARNILLVLLLFCSSVFTATFTVSQDGGGMFETVQAAVNAAGADGSGDGDEVVILDFAIYEEQVTIDSTCSGLTLRSAIHAAMSKPAIRWQDKENIHPKNCEEAKQISTVNYDMNGALQVLRVRNVTIDGIVVDGVNPWVFGADHVWDGDKPCQYALQHGNGGITLFASGDVVVRNCDIKNAYMGIAIKDRNEGGIFANANPADVAPQNVIPLSGFAKTGNHLIENNRIHNNSFGIYFESTWDLGR